MIRYEANSDGSVEAGETYTNFKELDEFKKILTDLRWQPKQIKEGRGGYYLFEVIIDKNPIRLNVYLKKLTFGGRDNRPFEKRAQFSAALDRSGFKDDIPGKEYSLILAIYKREKYDETVVCAWNIKDWGYNVGRAFNCFIDVQALADALYFGIAQHKTSIGQIACCFEPTWFLYYIENKQVLHKQIVPQEILLDRKKISLQKNDLFDFNDGGIPRFENLFQIIVDILKSHDGIASVDTMEEEGADILELTDDARQLIHNPNEGYRTEFGYRLAWARFYLRRAGLIDSPKRSIWRLTELGYQINEVDKEEVKKKATEKEFIEEINTDIIYNTDAENDVEVENNSEIVEIESPFDPNLVDIKTRTMSLDLILKRLNREEIGFKHKLSTKSRIVGCCETKPID